MVYVDRLMPVPPGLPWRWAMACHMEADSDVELLDMAQGIGLKPAWMQAAKPPRFPWPHFDLTPRMRAKAVAAGAVDEQSPRDTVARWRRWRSALSV